jgi:hypothetical protein
VAATGILTQGTIRWRWSSGGLHVPLGPALVGYVQKASVEHPPLIAAPKIKLAPPPSGQSVGPTCILVYPNSPEVVKVFSKSHALVG